MKNITLKMIKISKSPSFIFSYIVCSIYYYTTEKWSGDKVLDTWLAVITLLETFWLQWKGKTVITKSLALTDSQNL